MKRAALDVAIVGMACRFPGAPDLFAFWENVLAGRSAIREVPKSRWDSEDFFDPERSASDRVTLCKGGYLDEPIAFDAAAHGIMPRTVQGGEPEQFLVLDATSAALADAGLDPNTLKGSAVEVVIGRGNYFNRGNLTRLYHGRIIAQTVAMLAALHPEWADGDLDAVRRELKSCLPPFKAATIPGQRTNATAGRLASRFDFQGASYVVDAASASALAAVDLGARALVERRAELAIVGAVYAEADVDFPLVFSRLDVLSRSGESHPFVADADGMVPGEGVGVVVLKRLADAERDGNRVYAVIKGVGMVSDGQATSLTAPNARGHLRAIRSAYRQSHIDPATVQLIEGHGLGVPAADRAELRAILAAFPPSNTKHGRTLGAVSALIGHAMPAAGMAGLIKAALALYHRMLPISLGADRPHALLQGARNRISLNPGTRPWIHSADSPRRAGVNAFGFAGINAHVVLEEHTASADGSHGSVMRDWPDEAILLTAASRHELAARARQLSDHLSARHDLPLRDVAYTLNRTASASPAEFRLGLVVRTTADLVERLATIAPQIADPTCQSIRDGRGVYFFDAPLARTGRLAFLFPGEGSQYPNMLADLCPHFPIVRAQFEKSDRLAFEYGSREAPSDQLFGATDRTASLWESATAVNIVLSSQLAIFRLLGQLGLHPDAVLGHSSGEFLALAAAGAVQVDRRLEEQFNELAALFARLESDGTLPAARLVSVATNRERVESVLAGFANQVNIAIDNCPHQVVMAGDAADVEQAVQRLKEVNVACEDLPFARAYHTPAFEAVIEPIQQFFDRLEIAPPRRSLYSCCLRGRMPSDPQQIRRAAVAQWTRPVEFRRTIEAMHNDGVRLFVDVGARGNLAGFAEDTLRGRPAFAIAANLPRRSGLTQINHVVASLFAHEVAINVEPLYERRRTRMVDVDAVPPVRASTVTLQLGFPEMRLSEALVTRLRASSTTAARTEETAARDQPLEEEREIGSQEEDALVAYMADMSAFLRTQRQVMQKFLGARGEHEFAASTVLSGRVSPSFDANAHEFGAGFRDGRAQSHDDAASAFDSDLFTDYPADTGDDDARPHDHGPWAGRVVSMVEGQRVTARIVLDKEGDPVAESHTFGGRRVSNVEPSRLGLPVLPLTVMAEMLIDVASRLSPGAILSGLKDVRARRWIRYEERPSELEVIALADPEHPGEIRAQLFNRASEQDADGSEAPAVEGTIVFADQRRHPPKASPVDLGETETCRFTARSMYEEQWLFHGPKLRAVVGVGPISRRGIEGTLRVPPRNILLRPSETCLPKSELVVLDAYTHLLGAWGLDRLPAGDVIFPLRLGSLLIFGDDPPEGTDVACRISVTRIERHRVRVQAEILRPDGLVWMRLCDWDDWRFYWPPRYRDVMRRPDRELLGEVLPLRDETDAVAVWLEPPGDMGRPVWRDVLEYSQLSPEERAGCLKPMGDERLRTLRLWGRIAAKEAARRIWLTRGEPPVFPADLVIEPDAEGRPILRSKAHRERDEILNVSIAYTDGVAVGIAVPDPDARVGIDVVPIGDGSEKSPRWELGPDESSLLARVPDHVESEWRARFWAAKQAVTKALGQSPRNAGDLTEMIDFDGDTGSVLVSVARCGDQAQLRPSLSAQPAFTERRGDYIWAWTISRDLSS
jgi:acyl transferase domain-containing protein/phosphopantetheinyl transferase (holo-ACP synthase)